MWTVEGSVHIGRLRASGTPRVRQRQHPVPRRSLEKAFAHPGPAVVEVVTDPNALSIPPRADLRDT